MHNLNCREYTNVLQTKWSLYYYRCFRFGLELYVSYMYDSWAAALNKYDNWVPNKPYFPGFKWPLEVYQAYSIQIRSGRTGCGCGVCLGVVMYKMLAFLPTQPYSKPHILKTCELCPKHALQTLPNTPFCTYMYFKSQNYDHLKATVTLSRRTVVLLN